MNKTEALKLILIAVLLAVVLALLVAILAFRSPMPPPALAPRAPHQSRPARDAAHALERRGMVSGQGRVQEGARASERDPARGLVQLAHD